MLFSMLPYALIVQFMGGESKPGSFGESLVLPLGFVAIMMAGSALFIRRLLLGKKRSGQPMDQYRSACIISWVLMEAPSLLGLVLAFTGANRLMFYAFLGLSIAGMVIMRPSKPEFERFCQSR